MAIITLTFNDDYVFNNPNTDKLAIAISFQGEQRTINSSYSTTFGNINAAIDFVTSFNEKNTQGIFIVNRVSNVVAIETTRPNEVFVSATEGLNNNATVTVNIDNTGSNFPSITLLGGQGITLFRTQPYIEEGATATDAIDGDLTANIIITGTVDVNTIGLYILTYSVTNSEGNTSEISRNVNVAIDDIPPVITLIGNEVIDLQQGDTYNELGATAEDNVDGDITGNIVITGSVDTNTEGSYTITYTVSDTQGNQATRLRTVIVNAVPFGVLDVALVRSPHYVNIPFDFTTTTAVDVNVYIWNGNFTETPASPIYDLTLPRPSIDFQEFNVDISPLVKSELEPKPMIDLVGTPKIIQSSDSTVKWVQYDVSYIDSTETIPDISFTRAAIEGFGLYPEGVNPSYPSDKFLSDCKLRKVSRDGIIILPFINDGSIIDIFVQTENLQLNNTITALVGQSNNDYISYVIVDVSLVTTDRFITISSNGSEFVYEILDECIYQPKQIVFKNRYGVFETMTMFKRSSERINVKKDAFNNQYLQNGIYSTIDHQIKNINVFGNETIKVNSGYIDEEENLLYKQLMVSDQIWFYENDLIPITLKSNSLDLKTRINDRLVNYELEFEYAYNFIQNV